jgi:energy-coupling factor transporter ATP-binding protein EcfA2
MNSDLHSSLWQWIQTLPPWQSDLLRRLTALEDFNDGDVEDAVSMVLKYFGFSTDGPAPLPLPGLPATGSRGTAKILSLSNLVNVGAIKDGQRLEFKPDMLTIVYGHTGSGKTSYARVLRKACRSSAKPFEILPNVLNNASQSRAGTAQIEVSIDGNISTITRDVNSPPEELLAEITIFDSDCANVYVNEENELIYTPSSLRLLEKLASFQDQIRKKVQLRIADLGANTLPIQSFDPATRAGMLVNSLSDEGTVWQVDSLAAWTTTDASRLDLLRSQVSTSHVSPPVDISRLERRANSYMKLANELDRLTSLVVEITSRTLAALNDGVIELKNKAANLLAATPHTDPLAVDAAKWPALWRAAYDYASAVPMQFPPSADSGDVNCPLCQQLLSVDSRHRLVRLQNHALLDIDGALGNISKERARILADVARALSEARTTAGYLEAILEADAETENTVRQFLDAFCARAEAIIAATDIAKIELHTLPDCPSSLIREKAEQLRTEATSRSETASTGPSGEMLVEIAELENRLLLSRYRDAIVTHLDALKRCAQLKVIHGSIATTGLSRKIGEFTDSAVTDQLRTRLLDELQALGGDHIPVRITTRGAKGKTRVSLQLNAAKKAEVAYVLSEGERRAVALAFFLAEVAVSEHHGGIILDDPVSSLDHACRSYVARRIVEEAARRQAIVFTHDIVFLTELQAFARQGGFDPVVNALRRVADESGVTSQSLPWIAQNVKGRLGHLRQELQKLQATERRGEQEQYRSEVKVWFELLREAWERAVEEKLFKGVVSRFQPAIETLKLKTVEVTSAMTAAVERGMTRASLWTHDQAAALGKPPPQGSELKDALAELEEFVAQFK